jgi:hypothetical protein
VKNNYINIKQHSIILKNWVAWKKKEENQLKQIYNKKVTQKNKQQQKINKSTKKLFHLT